MWSHRLTVQNYQDLIDRGWRRSGKYCYKANMDKTCCPHYTIKCEVLNFKMNKSHKKVIKQFNKYIISGVKKGEKTGGNTKTDGNPAAEKETVQPSSDPKPADQSDKGEIEEDKNDEEKMDKKTSDNEASHTIPAAEEKDKKIKEKWPPKKGEGADPNKPKCKKAKQMRQERKKEKKMNNSSDVNVQEASSQKVEKSTEKGLEDYLNEYKEVTDCAHKFEIRLIRSCPRSKEFNDSFKQSHSVYHSYQMAIHNDPPSKPNESQYTRFLCDSPLQIRLVRVDQKSSMFRSSFHESHKVFEKYQMSVHHEALEDCTKSSFEDFLVQSPLKEENKEGGIPSGYGSFHQHYILDGKIIAVGVIDILPYCVSSVYLYYHPDYDFLSLGTYAALQEIAFVRSLQRQAPDLLYYYMGYYIHSCPKMRYKGQYYPSFLLCPEVYSWHLIQDCVPKLDENKYSRFAEKEKEDENGKVKLNEVKILFMRQAMTYEIYRTFNPKANDESEVQKYARFVGCKGASGMLLFRN